MRRLLGIVAGLLAAIIGTVVLFSVVENSSKTSDEEQPQLGKVLVVTTQIPKQTPVEAIAESVQVVDVPIDLIVPGAVSSVADISPGFISTADLLPGEQVIAARFVDRRVQSRVQVPEGLQEITIALPSVRVLGGTLVAGDQIGVVGSFAVTGTEGQSGQTSTFIVHRTLVTMVQYSLADATQVDQLVVQPSAGANRFLNDQIFVTVALPSQDVLKVVFAAEYGSLWLSLENAQAVVGEETPVTLGDLVPVATP